MLHHSAVILYKVVVEHLELVPLADITLEIHIKGEYPEQLHYLGSCHSGCRHVVIEAALYRTFGRNRHHPEGKHLGVGFVGISVVLDNYILVKVGRKAQLHKAHLGLILCLYKYLLVRIYMLKVVVGREGIGDIQYLRPRNSLALKHGREVSPLGDFEFFFFGR